MDNDPNSPTAQRLRAQADATHAQYPQYAGHWDGWIAVTCTRPVKSRGRVIVAKGAQVLMDPTSPRRIPHDARFALPHARGKVFATFYCPDNLGGCDTSLRVDYFNVPADLLVDVPDDETC